MIHGIQLCFCLTFSLRIKIPGVTRKEAVAGRLMEVGCVSFLELSKIFEAIMQSRGIGSSLVLSALALWPLELERSLTCCALWDI